MKENEIAIPLILKHADKCGGTYEVRTAIYDFRNHKIVSFSDKLETSFEDAKELEAYCEGFGRAIKLIKE